MINVSSEFLKKIYEERSLLHKVLMTLADGTYLELDDSQLMSGGVKIEDGVSNPGSFDIGSAIINKSTIMINNIYGDYDNYDFYDAIVKIKAGMPMDNGTTEWLDKGVFTVDDPQFSDGVITLGCLDNMHRFEKSYDSEILFPTTLAMIYRDACDKCGVTYSTTLFPNHDYVVNERPKDENLTYREMILYVSQLAGCYARCNYAGMLEMKSFDFSVFDNEEIVDGDFFNNENITETVDGGQFTDSVTDTVDGGDFTSKDYHVIYRLSNPTINTDDIMITGIQVTEEFEETEAETDDDGNVTKPAEKRATALFGESGYVLDISGNPLIQKGQASAVATMIGAMFVGVKFRPMSVQALANPSIEAGDLAIIVDRKSNAYQTIISNLTYQSGNYETLTADAETVNQRRSERNSELSKELIKLIREEEEKRKAQITKYEEKVLQLTETMANASGLFTTTEEQDDGSNIYYMHDKESLEDSVIIWKMTREAFAVSTNGGTTWNAGITINGEVIASILTAIGINAEWITTGILTDRAGKNIWNMNNGNLSLNGVLRSYGSGTANGVEIADGRIRFYLDESFSSAYADIHPGTMSGTSYGGVTFRSNRQYLGLALGETVYYFLNNGAAYNGYTERHILADNVRISGDIYANAAHTTGSVYIGSKGRYLTQYGDDSDAMLGAYHGFYVDGDLKCTGTKNRVVATRNYGNIAMNAVETASAYFSDMGSGTIGEDGTITIFTDVKFLETVDEKSEYQVFITNTSEKTVDFIDKQVGCFVVHGDPGATFDWIIYMKQRDYVLSRMDETGTTETDKNIEFDESVFYRDDDASFVLNEMQQQYEKEIDLL